eukprot:scaffold693_cov291-Chaetoceros_neogracile.AAC.1
METIDSSVSDKPIQRIGAYRRFNLHKVRVFQQARNRGYSSSPVHIFAPICPDLQRQGRYNSSLDREYLQESQVNQTSTSRRKNSRVLMLKRDTAHYNNYEITQYTTTL